jgi:hypothetical protein
MKLGKQNPGMTTPWFPEGIFGIHTREYARNYG